MCRACASFVKRQKVKTVITEELISGQCLFRDSVNCCFTEKPYVLNMLNMTAGILTTNFLMSVSYLFSL